MEYNTPPPTNFNADFVDNRHSANAEQRLFMRHFRCLCPPRLGECSALKLIPRGVLYTAIYGYTSSMRMECCSRHGVIKRQINNAVLVRKVALVKQQASTSHVHIIQLKSYNTACWIRRFYVLPANAST